ncbi:unnamed protein product [Brugia timori]|uniref:C-type lectin domain-containing protein n=1 Tax=Brugia timori TaxID=42155 RepID=A0A0R3QM52_9BILA|nr:unnamed protein product [Brugia timori]
MQHLLVQHPDTLTKLSYPCPFSEPEDKKLNVDIHHFRKPYICFTRTYLLVHHFKRNNGITVHSTKHIHLLNIVGLFPPTFSFFKLKATSYNVMSTFVACQQRIISINCSRTIFRSDRNRNLLKLQDIIFLPLLLVLRSVHASDLSKMCRNDKLWTPLAMADFLANNSYYQRNNIVKCYGVFITFHTLKSYWIGVGRADGTKWLNGRPIYFDSLYNSGNRCYDMVFFIIYV